MTAQRIYIRTKKALKARSKEWKWLGNAENFTNKGRSMGIEAIKQNAYNEGLKAGYLAVNERAKGQTLQAIADRLNKDNYVTRKGKKFKPVQVSRLIQRYKDEFKK